MQYARRTAGVTNVCGTIILKWVAKKLGEKVWAGFIWLRLGSSGGLL
jgi:hypothetical protein